jgi:hypothetical protein
MGTTRIPSRFDRSASVNLNFPGAEHRTAQTLLVAHDLVAAVEAWRGDKRVYRTDITAA